MAREVTDGKVLVLINELRSLRKWQTLFFTFLKEHNINFEIFEIGPLSNSFISNKTLQRILKLEKKLFKVKDNIFTIAKTENLADFTIKETANSGASTIINLSDSSNTSLNLSSPKNGVWEFNFSKDGRYLYDLPVFPELRSKEGFIGIELVAQQENESKLIDTTFTTLHDLSIYNNINKLFQSVLLLLKRNVLIRNEIALKKELRSAVTANNNNKTSINNLDFIKRLFSFGAAYISNKLIYNQWNIHISFDPNSENLKDFKIIKCPKDRFWADPFYINYEGQHFVFVEELLRKDKVAHLAVLEIDEGANLLNQQVILKKDFHLSYPQVFKHLGEYYMVPESESNRSIDLYKSTSFPYEWKHELTLMEGVRAADATLFQQDNKWWLFANITEFEGTIINDELSLFYTDDLFNPDWKPHQQNPIVKDCRSARPAGKLFLKNNKLYRPSQNCSFIYGYGININEVEVLNENEYKEKVIKTYVPNWMPNLLKNHTYNYFESGIVIDAMHKKSKLV